MPHARPSEISLKQLIPYRPGQSGNPNGRAVDYIGHLVRTTQTAQMCYDLLVQVVEGKVRGAQVRDRINAARYLVDRGYGQPPRTIQIEGQVTHTGVLDGQPVSVLRSLLAVVDSIQSPEELSRLLDLATIDRRAVEAEAPGPVTVEAPGTNPTLLDDNRQDE